MIYESIRKTEQESKTRYNSARNLSAFYSLFLIRQNNESYNDYLARKKLENIANRFSFSTDFSVNNFSCPYARHRQYGHLGTLGK
jgi:hypothetical protein